MFFDDYPLFYETSKTASSKARLNVRHQAIIEANRDILKDARVLDLASHDGRWSFAALKAGAAHVTGVEARPRMSRVPWNFGGGPVSIRLRSRLECCSRLRQFRRRHALRARPVGLAGACGR